MSLQGLIQQPPLNPRPFTSVVVQAATDENGLSQPICIGPSGEILVTSAGLTTQAWANLTGGSAGVATGTGGLNEAIALARNSNMVVFVNASINFGTNQIILHNTDAFELVFSPFTQISYTGTDWAFKSDAATYNNSGVITFRDFNVYIGTSALGGYYGNFLISNFKGFCQCNGVNTSGQNGVGFQFSPIGNGRESNHDHLWAENLATGVIIAQDHFTCAHITTGYNGVHLQQGISAVGGSNGVHICYWHSLRGNGGDNETALGIIVRPTSMRIGVWVAEDGAGAYTFLIVAPDSDTTYHGGLRIEQFKTNQTGGTSLPCVGQSHRFVRLKTLLDWNSDYTSCFGVIKQSGGTTIGDTIGVFDPSASGLTTTPAGGSGTDCVALHDMMVSVSGGAVSSIVIKDTYKTMSYQVASATGWGGVLFAGQYINITYSTAPTVTISPSP